MLSFTIAHARGDHAAGQAARTPTGPGRGPGTIRIRGHELPLFAVLGGLGTGIALSWSSPCSTSRARLGRRLAGARDHRLRALPPQPGALASPRPQGRDAQADRRARGRVRVGARGLRGRALLARRRSPPRRGSPPAAAAASTCSSRSPCRRTPRSTPRCPSRRRRRRRAIDSARVRGGRRVTGHWEKVRAGRGGPPDRRGGEGDPRARRGDAAAAASAPARRSSGVRSRPCSPSGPAA